VDRARSLGYIFPLLKRVSHVTDYAHDFTPIRPVQSTGVEPNALTDGILIREVTPNKA